MKKPTKKRKTSHSKQAAPVLPVDIVICKS